jgi:hypothetical protein
VYPPPAAPIVLYTLGFMASFLVRIRPRRLPLRGLSFSVNGTEAQLVAIHNGDGLVESVCVRLPKDIAAGAHELVGLARDVSGNVIAGGELHVPFEVKHGVTMESVEDVRTAVRQRLPGCNSFLNGHEPNPPGPSDSEPPSRPIRVALVHDIFNPGGVETFVLTLGLNLNAEFQVEVFITREGPWTLWDVFARVRPGLALPLAHLPPCPSASRDCLFVRSSVCPVRDGAANGWIGRSAAPVRVGARGGSAPGPSVRMALYAFACMPVRACERACVCMRIHRSIYTLRRAWLAVQNGIRVSLFPVFAHDHNQHHIVNGTAARELVHALSGVDVAHSTFGGGPIDQILLAAQVGR